MVVVLANNIPPAVRGRMKLWFVEPRPNVFISAIKDSVADNVVKFLYKHCLHSLQRSQEYHQPQELYF